MRRAELAARRRRSGRDELLAALGLTPADLAEYPVCVKCGAVAGIAVDGVCERCRAGKSGSGPGGPTPKRPEPGDLRAEALAMHEAGASWHRIAKRFDISPRSAQRWVSEARAAR